ncbi:MAG: hypothetical protein JW804_08450 [Sedimentisphaerales bacterium]|nr:hypothetical protein [Sedimentisphaerales bacterium]
MHLSRDELELIFDFCMGVATSEQLEQCRRLIANNPEAAEFCATVQESLGPLDNWEVESCPDDLVEKTIARVNAHAQASQQKLEQLITEQKIIQPAGGSTIWINFVRRLAVAALFMVVGTVVLTSLRYARYRAWQIQCQSQLARIGQGISNYSNDNNGSLPAVATAIGSPWWKVGYQGQENVSNTRHIWLLPKGGYVSPNDFICPGVRKASFKPITTEEARKLNDFSDRQHISYSMRLICDKPLKASAFGNRIIISDMNPLFENLPGDFNKTLQLKLNEELMKLNSINHRRKGQNILTCDGAVNFIKTRQAEISNDDIFTIREQPTYEGVETPKCEEDVFLAP